MRFRALVETEDEGVFVELAFDVKEAFGRARAPVTVTVNGYSWPSTVAVYGGRSYLPLRREVREAAGIAAGDTIAVELMPR